MKRTLVIVVQCLFAVAVCVAQNSNTTYVIMATSQGTGSTSFAAGLNCQIVAQYDEIGIVIAQSSDPNFATQAAAVSGVLSVTQDQPIQIPPNEMVADSGMSIDDSANLAPVNASALPIANHETFSAAQWNLHQIHADQTANNGDRGNGAVRARVAILDTGIIVSHIDIAANFNSALSASFVPTEPSFIFPSNGHFSHGTYVAGIVAAPVNGIGTQGVAPDAELVAVKVLNDAGSGSFASAIQGLEYASGALVHADVINMSLGALVTSKQGIGPLMSALSRAVNHAEARGSLVVIAAGNNATELKGEVLELPAQAGRGLVVAATGPIGFGAFGFNPPAVFDRLASYSNFGSPIDIAAPGGDFVFTPQLQTCTVGPITTFCLFFDGVLGPSGKLGTSNRYSFADGTSSATPHVSGLAALIVGKFGHMNPQQLREIIQQSADDIGKPGQDPQFGYGRINALAALQ